MIIDAIMKNESSKINQIKIPALNCIMSLNKNEEPIRVISEYIKVLSFTKCKIKIEPIVKSIDKNRFQISAQEIKHLLALILVQQREKADLYQTEVAKRIGRKSASTIKEYESGRSEPSLSIFTEILKSMGISVHVSIS